MDSVFHFKRFDVFNSSSALKVGTDAVLLGAATILKGNEKRILDIGTGTGVIALMLAQRTAHDGSEPCDGKTIPVSGPQIIGIDIDAAAANEASRSFEASPWNERLFAQHCALSEYADQLYHPDGPAKHELFDLIVSNPPYYDDSLPAPDKRRNEARHTDSLSFREVISFAGDFLAPEGRLALILPFDVQRPLLRFASSFGLFPGNLLSVRTTSGKAPGRLIAQFTRSRIIPVPANQMLTIRHDGGYTDEYIELTKDFYLNF